VADDSIEPRPPAASSRRRAVDAVRGLAMIVMALDHLRDFLGHPRPDALTSGPVIFWDHALPGSPPSYGFSLLGVWAIWAGFVAALYPLCRWFATRVRPRR